MGQFCITVDKLLGELIAGRHGRSLSSAEQGSLIIGPTRLVRDNIQMCEVYNLLLEAFN